MSSRGVFDMFFYNIGLYFCFFLGREVRVWDLWYDGIFVEGFRLIFLVKEGDLRDSLWFFYFFLG